MINEPLAVDTVVSLIASSPLIDADVCNVLSDLDHIVEVVACGRLAQSKAVDVYLSRLGVLQSLIQRDNDPLSDRTLKYETALSRLTCLARALENFHENEVLIVQLKIVDRQICVFLT